jgi:hypothetical protein
MGISSAEWTRFELLALQFSQAMSALLRFLGEVSACCTAVGEDSPFVMMGGMGME